MSIAEVPIDRCEVDDKGALTRSRQRRERWERWLHSDPNHAIWPQIASMLLQDLTFRALAAAADADPESALHSPIIRRGLILGHVATQGLAVRRLVDLRKGVISLRKLNAEIKSSRELLTREIFIAGFGVPYDPELAHDRYLATLKPGSSAISWLPPTGPTAFVPSTGLHERFDRLSGVARDRRDRNDRIQKRIFERIEAWLTGPEISAVKDWCDNALAHASDQPKNLSALAPTFATIATAHRHIVRAGVALSTYVLHGPALGEVVPVLQYNQFHRFDRVVSDAAAQKAATQRWHELAKERNDWVADVFEALVA
jgi:hypothetical protein